MDWYRLPAQTYSASNLRLFKGRVFLTRLRGGQKVVISINLFFVVSKWSKTSRNAKKKNGYFVPYMPMSHLLLYVYLILYRRKKCKMVKYSFILRSDHHQMRWWYFISTVLPRAYSFQNCKSKRFQYVVVRVVVRVAVRVAVSVTL